MEKGCAWRATPAGSERRHCQLAADQGHAAHAQRELAASFGHGVARRADFAAAAARHYRLAAEQGVAAAQFSLGVCYERGEGVAQDWAQAVRYYRLAAEQGDARIGRSESCSA